MNNNSNNIFTQKSRNVFDMDKYLMTKLKILNKENVNTNKYDHSNIKCMNIKYDLKIYRVDVTKKCDNAKEKKTILIKKRKNYTY